METSKRSLFSESWLEKHGCAFVQNSWTVTELENSVSSGKGDSGWIPEGHQEHCKTSVMASICEQGRCLKIHRGVKGSPEDYSAAAHAGIALATPWWKAVNESMEFM